MPLQCVAAFFFLRFIGPASKSLYILEHIPKPDSFEVYLKPHKLGLISGKGDCLPMLHGSDGAY